MVYGRLLKNDDDSFVMRIVVHSGGVCIIPVSIFTSASLTVSEAQKGACSFRMEILLFLVSVLRFVFV